ncbi:hypothetical protein PSEUDO9AZ_10349 [Pseudomonas sp. 9AZ]|nr:hypothetical protein PSEUDO9AZ_10349 [Pseudomonas sp. 9AZ]
MSCCRSGAVVIIEIVISPALLFRRLRLASSFYHGIMRPSELPDQLQSIPYCYLSFGHGRTFPELMD